MEKSASQKRSGLEGAVLPGAVKDLTPASPVTKVQRKSLSTTLTLALFVQAGGRCQRRGCNRRILEQDVSKQPGNFCG